MANWINDDLFKKFKEQVQEEESKNINDNVDFSVLWQKPVKGTSKKPEKYVVRLVPDKNKDLFKSEHFHFFKVEDNWKFYLCPKTFDNEAYCPFCAVTAKLYKGTDEDKKLASQYKRKEQYITNAYIVSDPRDEDRDDDKKVNGTIKIYEFPKVLKNIIQESMLDDDLNIGINAYNPYSDGYDFIIKIGAKDKDKSGQEWPDYSLSSFSRQQYPILEDDEDIDELMKTTHDLTEYLKSRKASESAMIDTLKELLLYPLIKDDYEKRLELQGKTITKEKIVEEQSDEEEAPFDIDDEPIKPKKKVKSSDPDEDDLLAQLKDL